MRCVIVLVALLVLAGCQSPCLLCSTPEAVVISLKGNVENLRIIEKEIVDPMPAGAEHDKWKTRLAAFITESRGILAWATREDFDVKKVLEEERKE